MISASVWFMSRPGVKWMLHGIIPLNLVQLAYLSLRLPQVGTLGPSALSGIGRLALFWFALARIRGGRVNPSVSWPMRSRLVRICYEME